jgi:hypothetical protein
MMEDEDGLDPAVGDVEPVVWKHARRSSHRARP